MSALAGLAVVSCAARAQEDDETSCRSCRIQIERVTRLGDREGPGGLAGRDLIAVDGRGRFYASSVARRGEIAAFGPDGRFLRVIGRTGQGPGEFSLPHPIRFGTADTMIVFDVANYRITTLSPNYEHVATVPISGYVRDAVRLESEEWIAVATVPTASRAGLPLHLLDLHTGEYRHSFGSEHPVLSRRNPYADVRWASAAEGRTLWITYYNRYRFELWNAAGELITTVEPRQDWFMPWDQREGSPYLHRPEPAVRDIWYDRVRRHIWVMTEVPARNWRPRREPSPRPTRMPLEESAMLHDVVVQVFTTTGELLATARFEQHFERFAHNGLMIASGEDDEGYPFIELWRPILHL